MKRLASSWILLLCLASGALAADLGDGAVRLRSGWWNASTGPAPRRSSERLPDSWAWVVAFDPPADEALRSSIEAAGGRIVGYVPSNAYLVRGGQEAAAALRELPSVRRVEGFRSEWKVAPELDVAGLRTASDARVHVVIWDGDDPHAVAARARDRGIEVLAVHSLPGVRRLVVRATSESVPWFATLAEVEWIEAAGRFTLRNDTTRWVIQSNDGVGFATPLHARGLFGAGEIIGHIDETPYMLSCFFADTLDNTPGPLHRKVVGVRAGGSGSHGTHTAGVAIGENFDLEAPQFRGMAPKARLSHTSFEFLHGEFDSMPSNVASLFTIAHDEGARIHTNSYGDDNRTFYTSWCVDIDAFSRQHEDDLVIFAASNLATLRTPENAKNSLAVGATFTAPNQHLRWSGGAGPTVDGRRKPDVYAPGRDIRSAQGGALCGTILRTGTSFAAPAVAGGAALVREYFRRGFFPSGKPFAQQAFTPTGALIKAIVINSAVDLTGEPGYPSNTEGWGRILLDNSLYFDGDARRLWLRDVRHAEGLATGEIDEWRFQILGAAEPLRITMAFMDQPGSLAAAVPVVNNLDLEVEGPGVLYRGNVIDVLAGLSTPGGAPDALNDVERVLVASPPTGEWIIRIRGAAVPMGPQGYAVVVNGDLHSRDFRTGVAPGPPDSPGPGAPQRLPATTELRIEGPTPNPFRTSTTLRFAVAEAGRVEILVYDVSGRAVRHLLARAMDEGEHRVTWDGHDDAGDRVGPGIYFVRLVAPGAERIVKTALLR